MSVTSETIVVLNPFAGGGTALERWHRHADVVEARLGRAEVVLTASTGDAIAQTRDALRGGARRVIAVGGDGTVNGVVNGFFDGETGEAIAKDAVLAVLPIGTGNDFARSIGLYGVDVSVALARAEVRAIDVGAVTVTSQDGRPIHRAFANTASFGISSRIAANVDRSSKRLGGWLAYWVGTARALVSERAAPVRMRFDGDVREGVVSMVVVGNGRYVGGGMKIAPDARMDDGLLDVITIDQVGIGAFLRHSRRLYAGTHVSLPIVDVTRVRRFEAESLDGTPGRPVLADVEGEPVGGLPFACEVRPGALRVLAPWASAEAVGPEAVGPEDGPARAV
jgi:YegS/Rv2252/BmrU family lipid kinase